MSARRARNVRREDAPRGKAPGSLWTEYVRAAAVVASATVFCALTFRFFEIANLIMIYLLAIVLVALRGGRGASLFAAALSVAAFNFFFVPPRFTFAVSDVRYVVTFAVMFVVGAIISSLTVRIREQAEASRLKEQRTAALYWLTRELAKRSHTPEIVAAATRSIEQIFEGRCLILLPGPSGAPEPVPGEAYAYDLDETELGAARWAAQHREPSGAGTATLPGAKALYLPLASGSRNLGVVGLKPHDAWKVESPEQRQLLATFCRQTAVALERTILAEEAREAERRVEREELRNSLLSSVSHDLRTPLAAITGAATALLTKLDTEDFPPTGTRRDLLETIAEEAGRLNRLVRNLLDMTRVESGGLEVKKEWTPLEEVIGAALGRSEALLRGRAVHVNLAPDLPLVPLDGVLMEQVFLNLLENVAKYTPAKSPVDMTARAEPGRVFIDVLDRGPGLPEGAEERIFEKFFRGRSAGAPVGTGLGLAIARGIVLAHGGTIMAANRPGGGARFEISLPVEGAPPAVEREVEEEAVS